MNVCQRIKCALPSAVKTANPGSTFGVYTGAGIAMVGFGGGADETPPTRPGYSSAMPLPHTYSPVSDNELPRLSARPGMTGMNALAATPHPVSSTLFLGAADSSVKLR